MGWSRTHWRQSICRWKWWYWHCRTDMTSRKMYVVAICSCWAMDDASQKEMTAPAWLLLLSTSHPPNPCISISYWFSIDNHHQTVHEYETLEPGCHFGHWKNTSTSTGLGGRWGPYRLDVGQRLVQVSEDSKQGLDEETKRKTQEMADAAYKQRWKKKCWKSMVPSEIWITKFGR